MSAPITAAEFLALIRSAGTLVEQMQAHGGSVKAMGQLITVTYELDSLKFGAARAGFPVLVAEAAPAEELPALATTLRKLLVLLNVLIVFPHYDQATLLDIVIAHPDMEDEPEEGAGQAGAGEVEKGEIVDDEDDEMMDEEEDEDDDDDESQLLRFVTLVKRVHSALEARGQA